MQKKWTGTFAAAAMLALLAVPALAGNQQMVERRIQELDQQNRQVVGALPEIPSTGRLSLKARVGSLAEGRRVEILEKSNLTSGLMSTGMDDPDGTYISMRQGLTGKPPVVRAATAQVIRTTADGYLRFGDGLRRYIRQGG